MTLTIAGAGMLWVGWLGFNGGSALAADGNAAMAIVATHVSAAAGAFTWMVIEWIRYGKPSALGAVTGMVAGLGTVTAGAGYVSPGAAMVIGVCAGVVCFFVTQAMNLRSRIDDSLDVFAVHAVGGALGTILVGVFASSALGFLGGREDVGIANQLRVQFIGVLAVGLYAALVSYLILRFTNLVAGNRVSEADEVQGLDLMSPQRAGLQLVGWPGLFKAPRHRGQGRSAEIGHRPSRNVPSRTLGGLLERARRGRRLRSGTPRARRPTARREFLSSEPARRARDLRSRFAQTPGSRLDDDARRVARRHRGTDCRRRPNCVSTTSRRRRQHRCDRSGGYAPDRRPGDNDNRPTACRSAPPKRAAASEPPHCVELRSVRRRLDELAGTARSTGRQRVSGRGRSTMRIASSHRPVGLVRSIWSPT